MHDQLPQTEWSSDVEYVKQELATLYSSASGKDADVIRTQIDHFDTFEPRFSGRVLELAHGMGEDEIYAHGIIKRALLEGYSSTDPRKFKKRIRYTLQDATLQYSSDILEEYKEPTAFEWDTSLGILLSKKCDRMIREANPELRPDIYRDSLEDLRHYYQKLATASYVLKGRVFEKRYRKEVSTFVSWAGNDEARLAFARGLKSVHVGHLKAILDLQEETPSPLHGGLI